MDKQREEFYKAYPRHEGILELYDAGSLQYLDAFGAVRDFMVWQAAQAAMQPEIEFWEQLSKGQQDAYNSVVKQLSAANQRIAELEATIADWNRRCEAGNNKLDWLDAVERVSELEAIIKASQEQEQEPVAYVDSEQLRRWDVLRGTDYESPERCYMPWSRDRFKTDLTNCDFPVYAALVIKEQYKVVFYINPDDLVVDKADKKYVTDIPCDGCTEALFIKEQLCAHGRALNDYCELCGRIHSA